MFDSIKTSIEADLFSTANPSVTCENIIDEVVTARGSLSTLDTRLDVSLNNDGTLKSQATLVTAADAKSLPQANTVLNDIFIVWAAGDSAAPTGWTLAGTGAACARAGTSLADTARKVGDFCAKLTYGSTTLTLVQDVLPTAAFTRLSHLQATTVGFGAWVKSAVASQARVFVTDGVTTTYTSYHTGDGTWQFLATVHAISGTGTKLQIGISVESSAGNPAYLSGATLLLTDLAPENWRPTPNTVGTVFLPAAGVQTTGTGKGWYTFNRMGIVKHIECNLRTAPTGGTTFKVDVNRGGTTMLASVIAFTASDKNAGKAPDGTYSQYCFPGNTLASGTTITNELTYDIDDIGSTIAGSDLSVKLRVLVFLDPFESAKAA
jgi:hypothetical protein